MVWFFFFGGCGEEIEQAGARGRHIQQSDFLGKVKPNGHFLCRNFQQRFWGSLFPCDFPRDFCSIKTIDLLCCLLCCWLLPKLYLLINICQLNRIIGWIGWDHIFSDIPFRQPYFLKIVESYKIPNLTVCVDLFYFALCLS